MYKAVIFDSGGVLHDISDELVLKEFRGEFKINNEQFYELIGELFNQFETGLFTEDDFIGQVYQRFNKEISKNSYNLLRGNYEKNYHLYPDIQDLVKSLNQKDIKTAVISNTNEVHTQISRSKKAYQYFDLQVMSWEIKIRKPNPRIYTLTLEKLGVQGSESIFIDDLEENLIPAKNLGITTVLARNPRQVVEDVKELLNI